MTSSSSAGRGDRYLLGDSTAEVEHLVRQAEVYAEEAGQLLERVGAAAGASVIDVGRPPACKATYAPAALVLLHVDHGRTT